MEWKFFVSSLPDDEKYSFSTLEIDPNNFLVSQAGFAVDKEFNDLTTMIEEKDRTGTDWSYKLRTFALPRTDKSILDKGNYSLSKAIRNFSDLLDEQLRVLEQYPQLLS
jgi:hypothetical protein